MTKSEVHLEIEGVPERRLAELQRELATIVRSPEAPVRSGCLEFVIGDLQDSGSLRRFVFGDFGEASAAQKAFVFGLLLLLLILAMLAA